MDSLSAEIFRQEGKNLFPAVHRLLLPIGWPVITHAELPEELAYHLVSVLDRIHGEIPYDSAQTPPMSSLCRDTREGPLDIPLHPGAERYYREQGYL